MSEQFYDEQIAPVLLELADKCEQNGLSFIARVDFGEGSGITQTKFENMDIGQVMTLYAARADGNFDSLAIAIKKKYGEGGSIVLHQMTALPPPNDRG